MRERGQGRESETVCPGKEGHGLWPWSLALGRDVAPLRRE